MAPAEPSRSVPIFSNPRGATLPAQLSVGDDGTHCGRQAEAAVPVLGPWLVGTGSWKELSRGGGLLPTVQGSSSEKKTEA